jgi:hypothetical protein
MRWVSLSDHEMRVADGRRNLETGLDVEFEFSLPRQAHIFPLPLPACAPAEIAACPPASRKIGREWTRNRDSRHERELEPEGKDEVVERSGVAARAAHRQGSLASGLWGANLTG